MLTKNTYDAILLDISLPDTDGTVLYNRFKGLKTELALGIIFVMGDTVSNDTLSFIEKTGKPYLTEPFGIERIRQVVADRLSDN